MKPVVVLSSQAHTVRQYFHIKHRCSYCDQINNFVNVSDTSPWNLPFPLCDYQRNQNDDDCVIIKDHNLDFVLLDEPRDIRIKPRKTIYAFGDRLRCSADGNPSPNYTWSSVLWTHMDRREGSVLVIEENAFNEAQFYSYRCTAFSSIFAANISVGVNFTIGQDKGYTVCNYAVCMSSLVHYY